MCSACAMTVVLVSVLYKHVCCCIGLFQYLTINPMGMGVNIWWGGGGGVGGIGNMSRGVVI